MSSKAQRFARLLTMFGLERAHEGETLVYRGDHWSAELPSSGGGPVYVGHEELAVVDRIVDYQIPGSWDGSIDIATLSGLDLVLGVQLIASCGANPGAAWRLASNQPQWVPGTSLGFFSLEVTSFSNIDFDNPPGQLYAVQGAIGGELAAGNFATFATAVEAARLRFRVTGTVESGVDPFVA